MPNYDKVGNIGVYRKRKSLIGTVIGWGVAIFIGLVILGAMAGG